MIWKKKLSKHEVFLCLAAVDELIKKWENLGVEVGEEWYALREKLRRMAK